MKQHLTILGCVPNLMNVLVELAVAGNGYHSFDVLKNIPVELNNFYQPLAGISVSYFDCFNDEWPQGNEKVFALSVVGGHSKPEVFNWFQHQFNYSAQDFVNLVHPSAVVAPSVTLTNALQLEALSIIASCTTIGFAVNIKRGSSIGHHCRLEEYVTINPGVTICSHVYIGRAATIGAGSVIRDGVRIGNNSIIGMGSVVTKDIPGNAVAYGNPCAVVKEHVT